MTLKENGNATLLKNKKSALFELSRENKSRKPSFNPINSFSENTGHFGITSGIIHNI